MESPTLPTAAPPELTAILAEDLPALYRAILDRVAELERIGARREAGRIRRSATSTYSAAWDGAALRVLGKLLARADHALAVPERARGWSLLRRRSAPAR